MSTLKLGSKTLTLKQFMRRSQVLAQYKSFLKTIKRLPDQTYAEDLIKWVRSDFKANKNVTDVETIKFHLSHGEKQLQKLERMISIL